jgi:hypothetical protein
MGKVVDALKAAGVGIVCSLEHEPDTCNEGLPLGEKCFPCEGLRAVRSAILVAEAEERKDEEIENMVRDWMEQADWLTEHSTTVADNLLAGQIRACITDLRSIIDSFEKGNR